MLNTFCNAERCEKKSVHTGSEESNYTRRTFKRHKSDGDTLVLVEMRDCFVSRPSHICIPACILSDKVESRSTYVYDSSFFSLHTTESVDAVAWFSRTFGRDIDMAFLGQRCSSYPEDLLI